MKCIELFLSVIAGLIFGQCSCHCDLNKFRLNNIVPIVTKKLPESPLEVSYDDNPIDCGTTVLRSMLTDAPSLSYPADNDNLYTLVMIDLDAITPQNPKFSPLLHWLIVNIPEDHISSGSVVTPYIRPNPPKYSDPHRYVILIYQQSKEIKDLNYTEERKNFDLNTLESSEQLKGPIAGHFFYVGQE